MSEFYYLVSSLPLLNLETSPVIDSEEFLYSCVDFLSDKEIEKLHSISLLPYDEGKINCNVLSEWYIWETKLRNTVLSQRTDADVDNPEKYLREEKDFFSEIQKGVQDAFSKNPREREEFLDRLRWIKIEELELGHDFDFTKLCLYKLQLLLCEKRKDRDRDKGGSNYDEIVQEIYNVDPLAPTQEEKETGKNKVMD